MTASEPPARRTPPRPRAGRPTPLVAAGLLALTLLPLLLLTPSAAAHADLVEAAPAPNTEIQTAPAELTATFSEPLEDTYTRVTVEGPDGANFARETRIHDDNRRRVTVPLEHPMPDGVYTVRWRTLSAADGHTRSGAYFLALNVSLQGGGDGPGAPTGADNGTDATGTTGGTAGTPGPLEPLYRGLGFAGASLAVGTPLFLLLAHGVGMPPGLRRRLRWTAAGGAALAALAGLGLATELARRIDADVATALATQNGQVLLLRVALFALAAGLLALAATRRWRDLRPTWLSLGTLLAAAGLLATSLGGHAAAEAEGLALAVIIDWLHQVAVAFWVAGVAALVLAATDDAVDEPAGAALVRRFSPLAVAAVAVIVLTGTAAALDRVPGLDDLWTTPYGLALLAKLLLLAPLVALGAYHRYRVLPGLERAGHAARDFSRLKWSAGAEVVLMAVVLVAAGLLTSFGPPTPGGPPTAQGEGAEPEPFYAFNQSGLHVRVYITPEPVTVGFQEVFVNVTALEGGDLNRSQLEAFLTLHPPGDPEGEATPREAHFLYNGTFHWGGALFTASGNWTATLVIQGGRGDAYRYVQEDIVVPVRRAEG